MEMLQLQKDSLKEVIEAVQSIEDQADLCFENLRLYSYPKGLAAWANRGVAYARSLPPK